MTYPLLVALGLLFFAVSSLITNQVGRIASAVLAAALFLAAVVVTASGPPE